MIFYLAGPMTGKPDFNFQEFTDQARYLRNVMGLEVRSPHEVNYGETPKTRGSLPMATYIKGGLKLLLECDAIIMMTGWEYSKGCMTEMLVAQASGMQIYFLDTDNGMLTVNLIANN